MPGTFVGRDRGAHPVRPKNGLRTTRMSTIWTDSTWLGGNFIQNDLRHLSYHIYNIYKILSCKYISKISKSSRLRPVPTGLAFAGLAACTEGSGSFALRTSGHAALDFVSLGTGSGSVGSVVCCWWQLHLKWYEIHVTPINTIFIKSCLAKKNINY